MVGSGGKSSTRHRFMIDRLHLYGARALKWGYLGIGGGGERGC